MTRPAAHTRIYLTGFMGTGKSTLGPDLARALGWAFFDLDAEIVRATGHPIPTLFELEGESGFREHERRTLEEICRRDRVVVALGGGAVLDPENRERLLATGLLVLLTAGSGVLAARLGGRAAERPLLQDETGRPLEGDALEARIRALLGQRRAAYDSAHVAVDTGHGSIPDTVRRIVEAVGERLNPSAT